MKVLAINGSPHANGSTRAVLDVLQSELQNEGIETEIIHIGSGPVRGCVGCGGCRKMEPPRCVYDDDIANRIIDALPSADGVILAAPVHYAGIAGAMKCVLDRVFYAGSSLMYYKVGMAFTVMRRSGGSATFDHLNHYFEFARMPIASSQYWNIAHGAVAEDVAKDLEGVQIMRTAAKNMAWLMKSIAAGKVPPPAVEPSLRTNFVR